MRTRYGAALLALAGILSCSRERATSDTAQAFVSDFYTWYLLPSDEGGAGTNLETAIKARPQLFDPALLAALREDLAASSANPGEVAGLDFDPFVNSQDPCEQYAAGAPVERSGRRVVPVNESCGGKQTRAPAASVVLVPNGDSWRISNVEYGEGETLLTILGRLKAERSEPSAGPAAPLTAADSVLPTDSSLLASLASDLGKCTASARPAATPARERASAAQESEARWSGSVRAFRGYSIFVPDSATVGQLDRATGKLLLGWPRCGEHCRLGVVVSPDSGVGIDARIARLLAEQRRIDSVNKDPRTQVMEFDEVDGPPRAITTGAGPAYEVEHACGDCASTTLMLGRSGVIADVSYSADAEPGAGTRMCEMQAVARTFRWRP